MNQLDSLIASLSTLPGVVESELAPKVAAAVYKDLKQTIAEGETAYGQAWKPKQDGTQPLRNAAKAVSVETRGATVIMWVRGVEARHHLGAVKGKVKRPILPDVKGLLPNKMYKDIASIASEALAEHLRG